MSGAGDGGFRDPGPGDVGFRDPGTGDGGLRDLGPAYGGLRDLGLGMVGSGTRGPGMVRSRTWQQVQEGEGGWPGSVLQWGAVGSPHTLLTMDPAECPSSSPRPDIGEVYADGVLLVWKPVESYGPVTYIVQCSLEGRTPPGQPRGQQGGAPWHSLGEVSLSPPTWAVPHPLPCGPGGSWTTMASDVFDCCHLASKLSRGGVYTFRTACVSKAGMGPYSSPSEEVLLGGPSHLGEPLCEA